MPATTRVKVTRRARVKIVRPRMRGWVFVVRMTELMKLDIVTRGGEIGWGVIC